MVKNTSKYLEIYDEAKENTAKLQNIVMDSYINKNVAQFSLFITRIL